MENNYPSTITTQQLMIVPSTKDISSIMRFLIGLIDPLYDVYVMSPLQKKDELAKLQKSAHLPEVKKQIEKLNKLKADNRGFDEDMVIQFFTYLKYHNVPDKKRLSGHQSWPHILSTLCWFTELLKYSSIKSQLESKYIQMALENNSFDDNWNHPNPGEAIFFEFLRSSFQAWMSDGDAGFNHVVMKWRKDVAQKNDEVVQIVRRLTEEKIIVDEEIQSHKEQEQNLCELETQKIELLKQIQTLKSSHEDYENQITLMEHEKSMRDQEAKCTSSELLRLTRERDSQKKQIQEQNIRPEDVMRMNQELTQLENEKISLLSTLDRLHKELYEQEMDLNNELASLNKNAKEYNRLASMRQLYDDEAMAVDSFQHELRVIPGNVNAGTFTKSSINLRLSINDVTSATQKLTNQFNANEKIIYDLDTELDKGTEALEMINEEILELDKRHKKLESAYINNKDMNKKDLQQLECEIEKVESDIEDIKTLIESTRNSLSDAERDYESAGAMVEALVRKHELEKREMNNLLYKILELLTSHKNKMLRIMNGVEARCREMHMYIKNMN
ncbi:hypothetical protein AKO1_015098 [Acrasis kona]|uniref:Kinetochore protein NDC80 homolog n=1 Tax=Acrasis kona TaxID=1008807 RepID=A0AAW2YYG5_9EUKA